MPDSANMDELQNWAGRSQTHDGLITASQADILAASLDRDDAPFKHGDPLPPGWHWIYFPEVVKLSDTARDGHVKTGGFMPPVPLPRRMWASNRMTFHKPLRIGEKAVKVATISSVTPKEGRSGKLCFVSTRFEIFGEDGLATTEDHSSVFREAAKPGASPPPAPKPPEGGVWKRTANANEVMLFRFSALTMNSHRIHYDYRYVTETEGYPGLLVHGPLTQVLLVDLFRRSLPDATLKTFEVRAVAPIYCPVEVGLEGRPGEDGKSASLWAINGDGDLAMTAEAAFTA